MKTSVSLTSVLQELTELAAENNSAPEFFTQLLIQASSVLEATAAACWMFDQNQSVGLLAEHHFQAFNLQDDLQATRDNQKILRETFASRQMQVMPFAVRNEHAIEHALLVPVLHKGRCIGALEFFGGGEPWDLKDGLETDLRLLIELIDRYLLRLEDLVRDYDDSDFLQHFERFCIALHYSLDPQHVAVTAVNDIASLLSCDRVTLLRHSGGHWPVLAINGSGEVNTRSSQLQMLQRLVRETAVTRQTLWYTGKADAIPDQLAEPLAAYVADSGCRMILLRPLFQKTIPAEKESDGQKKQEPKSQLAGMLVFEQFGTSTPGVKLKKHERLLSEQVSLALCNALAYHRVPLLPMLDFAGRQLEKLRTYSLTKLGVVLSLCLAVVGVLVFVPAEYHVTAYGKLMPAVQRRVFTEFDGEVSRLLVRPGDLVTAGTPLLELTNEAMEDELLQLRSQRDERRKSLMSLNSQVHSASRSSDREHLLHLQAEQEQCRIEISSLDSEIALAEKQIDRMTLRAPIEGTLVTFVDAQQLIGKPVRRGDTLLEIMDENGPWRLELEVSEHRLHHLQNGLRNYGETVPAKFKLTADPNREFSGTLSHVAERSTLNAEKGAVIQVHVSPAESTDLPCRIGADVRSKLDCGQYSLMYVWFGDVVEYAQREFWF
jgi:hypothetical protein